MKNRNLFISILMLLYLNTHLLAESRPHTCYLDAISLNNSGGAIIYDDYITKWPSHTNGSWNCGRQHLFYEYNGTGTNIQLTFAYDESGSEVYPIRPTLSHDIYIHNNKYDTNLTLAPIIIPDLDSISSSWTIFTIPDSLLILSGELSISYYRHGDIPGVDTPDIVGSIVLFPKIEKLWIEASPICSGFSDSFYKFQVHSIPELRDIIQPMSYSTVPFGGSCDYGRGIPYQNHLQLDFSASTIHVNHVSNFGLLNGIYTDYVCGFAWHQALDTTSHLNNNLTDFYFNSYDNTDINDITYYLPGGTVVGTPMVIRLTFSDGITTIIDSTPVIIKYPASLGYSASYHFTDYTVTGTETWTPTNNPITRQQNNALPCDTLNIKHQITIPIGSRLVIDSGLRLEMGPGAHVVVNNNSASGTEGGSLVIQGHSVLSAYRGCDGTDSSTWGGLIVKGDPTLGQGSGVWGATGHPQGKLLINNAEIDYADIAIQNGINDSSSGGMIYSLGAFKFYNNKKSVKLWPYHNHTSGGIPCTSFISLRGSTFINDTDAWFPSADFINATDIGTINLTECHFTNNTGRDINAAVMGFDAGFMVGNSSFTNFLTGLITSYGSSTNSLWLTGSSFDNNKWGLWANGAIDPVITDNSFHINSYTGSGSHSTCPGTSVLLANDQNIGALITGTSAYNLTSNTFNIHGYSGSGYYAYTTGTLEYNTGRGNNQVTDNTFTSLGVAMSSNYHNAFAFGGTSGLVYSCNRDTHVGYDIAVTGGTSPAYGINSLQATSSTFGSSPAGNKFGGNTHLFNVMQPFTYDYTNTRAFETPTVTIGPITLVSLGDTAHCYVPAWTGNVISIGVGTLSATQQYVVSGFNLNHYLTDTSGVPHRDSIYYWADQLGTPFGSLLISNLLIEDSLLDSAAFVYDSIFQKYQIDSSSSEGIDFVLGRNLLNLLAYKRTHNEALLTLDSTQVSVLQSVKSGAKMWAHARAESWLYAFNGEAYTDSLLYPADDTTTASRHSTTTTFVSNQTKPSPNRIYPNPAHDLLQIEYHAQTTEEASIQISDISGRILINKKLPTILHSTLDLKPLNPGMYLYQIYEGGNRMMVGKVMKE